MMTTTASHPRLTEEGRDNVFRLIGRNDRQGRLAGDFLAARWRDRRIALLHDSSNYGDGLAEEVWRHLQEHGVGEVLDMVYTPGQEDYSALAQQLRQAGIEVAYVGGYGPDAARILRAVRAHGDGLQLIGGHALGMDEFWAMAGPAGEGTIFTARSDTGLLPKEAPILAALRARGMGTDPSSAAAYAAVQVWAQAVRRAGTLDLAAVLQELHHGRFDTVIGSVAFDAKDDLTGADWQWQVWRHGSQELLNPAPALATR
jgi:branched-chain amino acid transport system substrate-binding protein